MRFSKNRQFPFHSRKNVHVIILPFRRKKILLIKAIEAQAAIDVFFSQDFLAKKKENKFSKRRRKADKKKYKQLFQLFKRLEEFEMFTK